MVRCVDTTCSYCGAAVAVPTGAFNRARRQGMALYCGRKCSGLGRRKNKSEAQKKEEKRLYGAEYLAKNRERRRRQKAEYYQRTRDPVKEAEIRKQRMHLHVEYCRRPEYRAYKREYDRRYRAEKQYGEFAECFLLVQDIDAEVSERADFYERQKEKGTVNKTQQRKRDYERTYCQ